MFNINYIIVPIVSYLLGSAPFALWITQLFLKKDLRSSGSRNIGSMNVWRMFSKEKGGLVGILFALLAFTLDSAKAIVAVIIAIKLLPMDYGMALLLGTFFAILGHNYSILLNFKGGRGAASLMGILLFFDWKIFVGWLAIVLLFMILFELFMNNCPNTKFVIHAISEQIIGRLFGEVAATYWIYIYNPLWFWPVLTSTILILIAHKDRLTEQLQKIKNNTYVHD